VLGTAVLGVGINLIGVAIVTAVIAAMNTTASAHQLRVVLTTTGVMVLFSVIVGVSLGAILQRRTLRWLLRGEPPLPDDAARALRMPRDMAVLAAALWIFGGAVISTSALLVGEDAQTVSGISGGIVLAALASAGITYLVIGRVNQPVARLALAASPPKEAPFFGVGWRLLLIWVLTSGMPVVGLVLVLTAPRGKTNVLAVGVVVAVTALVVGGYATSLSARSIGTPLRGMVDALHRVGHGNLDVEVQVEDAGEIGLLQNGFNEMVAGLRERERIQDLFGRHVGPAVAAEAISGGVTLRGEQRHVVAFFVDITGSTKLTRETDPVEFVDMLNRFFAIVVDEVESNGGLVNKFEGDAALCVFGAPAALDDTATAALCTARAIRDRVGELGEFDIGVGVAAGPAIAGQVGAASRLEYTVIGDAVNEAARLTELAKRVDGHILATDVTVVAATEDEQQHWVAGRIIRLRGRETPTRTYRSVTSERAPMTPASLARRITDVAKAVAELPQQGTHHRE
ncbi:MAG TPA: adenylate/guanylate cyclase domain-containing protein, partial [Jatrophihabitans sp.]|nr:adenylate/guanylate cyclase domain-containing protein [Jatrophihabitans sp.]